MLKRKLTFYRWLSVPNRPPFEPYAAAGGVAALVEQDPSTAILTEAEATTAVIVNSVGDPATPTRLQLLALRDPDNRPLQFGPGEPLAPIDMLADRYPADVTHVTLWPDGYAAQDFHGNAPRAGRLARYLRRQVDAFVNLEQLYQPDMLDRLDDIRGQLRGVDIALTRPEHVDQDPGVLGTLVPAVYGHRAPSVSVHVGMGRYGPRDRFLDAETEEAILATAERAQELVDSMVITGRSRTTGRSATVDLLNERLYVERELPRSQQGGSLPDAESAFAELEAAYRDLRDCGRLEEAVRAQAMRQD